MVDRKQAVSEAKAAFDRDGFALIKEFYDDARDIRPVQEGIGEIVALVAKKYGVTAPCGTAEEAMKLGYPALIAANRAWGGEVYDAVKQIPAFMALVANEENSALFNVIRKGAAPAIAAGGYGIRIDNPNEEKFKAPWHQEFPAQLRSLDGIVFWSPLVEIKPELGPVEIASGSHLEGPLAVYSDDGGIGKSGAYALRLEGETEKLAKYKQVAPLAKPGDLLIMDFLTLHQSGANTGSHPRWSMQWRYFNFRDPSGIKIGWKGSFASGQKFQDILPELLSTRRTRA